MKHNQMIYQESEKNALKLGFETEKTKKIIMQLIFK